MSKHDFRASPSLLPAIIWLATFGTFLPRSAHADVYRCTDGAGRVTYQQRKCDGSGASVDVTPANREDVTQGPAKLPPPAPAAPEKSPAKPAEASLSAVDRYSPYQAPGLRLAAGMSERQVIESWGLPDDRRDYGRGWQFLWWCDMRMALVIDGRLQAWDAPFPDSKRGATLFTYGEPWTHAAARWGFDRKNVPYSGPHVGRGEIQRWTPLRWIVTDSHGGIVGWCDAAEHRSAVAPPAFNPPWDNPVGR